jgi:hypothetical protein
MDILVVVLLNDAVVGLFVTDMTVGVRFQYSASQLNVCFALLTSTMGRLP